MDQKKKNFHRHFATPGLDLYWIIIAYIIVGWFYPVIGLLALICMIGPVMTSIWKGRWWCGPCQALAPMLKRLANEYDGRIKVLKVDVDKNQDLAQQMGTTQKAVQKQLVDIVEKLRHHDDSILLWKYLNR